MITFWVNLPCSHHDIRCVREYWPVENLSFEVQVCMITIWVSLLISNERHPLFQGVFTSKKSSIWSPGAYDTILGGFCVLSTTRLAVPGNVRPSKIYLLGCRCMYIWYRFAWVLRTSHDDTRFFRKYSIVENLPLEVKAYVITSLTFADFPPRYSLLRERYTSPTSPIKGPGVYDIVLVEFCRFHTTIFAVPSFFCEFRIFFLRFRHVWYRSDWVLWTSHHGIRPVENVPFKVQA